MDVKYILKLAVFLPLTCLLFVGFVIGYTWFEDNVITTLSKIPIISIPVVVSLILLIPYAIYKYFKG